jgi:hypothetical protein
MTFKEWIKINDIDVHDSFEEDWMEEAWNEARRTDPVKQQLLEALKEVDKHLNDIYYLDVHNRLDELDGEKNSTLIDVLRAAIAGAEEQS